MERRRVVFKIGVLYQTHPDNLKIIPEIIKQFIEEQQDTAFDRSHFIAYGDFSLIFETVYFVSTPDYNRYMDIHQEINLKIFNEFHKRGIGFAYPTQTLYMHKEKGFDEPKTEIVPLV
jgi:small-conductance mechanosensitive channel